MQHCKASKHGQPGMSSGESSVLARDEIAQVLADHQADLRRVARLRLSTSMVRLFDSADVFSTIMRRVDELAASGEVRFDSSNAVLAFARSMVKNTIIDKHRIVKRIERAESDEFSHLRGFQGVVESGSSADAESAIEKVMGHIQCPQNKFILWTWLAGFSQQQTADLLGMSVDALRHRWLRIRHRIADLYTPQGEQSQNLTTGATRS